MEGWVGLSTMSENNLLKVITRQRSWWDSNPMWSVSFNYSSFELLMLIRWVCESGCVIVKWYLQQLTAKFVQVGINNPSTPDSSSGSSTGSLHNMYDGPNLEAENCLPGVVSVLSLSYTALLYSFFLYRVSQNKTPQHENRHICVTP